MLTICLILIIGIAHRGGLAYRLFEGDIMGVDPRAMGLTGGSNQVSLNGARELNLQWPNRRVPYRISDIYTDDEREKILKAMEGFEKTCVRFVPKLAKDDHYLFIAPEPKGSCSSYIGRIEGQPYQPLVLSTGCLRTPGTIQHELMHVLGFWHEQSRKDRDLYVDVNFENILPEHQIEFRKHTKVDVTAFDQPYDFGSIMHYGKFDFAQNEKIYTIRPKRPNEDREIGQRKWLSKFDIKKISSMYKCGDVTTRTSSPVRPAQISSSIPHETSTGRCFNSCERYHVAIAPSCKCLRFQLLCDGNRDLSDGSDEIRRNCDFLCKLLETFEKNSDVQPYFQLEDKGTCLRKAWLCDGDKTNKYAVTQKANSCRYYCKGGGYFPTTSTSQCIHWRDLCDGLQDTTDGWDEEPANCLSACSSISQIIGVPLVIVQIRDRQRCVRKEE